MGLHDGWFGWGQEAAVVRERRNELGGRPLNRKFEGDPTSLPGATPFYGYLVDAAEPVVTIFYDHEPDDGPASLYVSEAPDAVRFVMVHAAPPAENVHYGYAGGWFPLNARARLQRPLGERVVVDALRDEPVMRCREIPDEPEWARLKAGGRGRRSTRH